MLKGIPKILTPDLLVTLARMGHGDEIVLADANFPGERLNRNIIRCDGSEISDLLEAVLQLFPLDKSVESPWFMMKPSDLANYDDQIEKQYHRLLLQSDPEVGQAEKIERFEFYKRASEAYAIVMTGTAKRFGNIILKKGIILL
jgi:L-fucose mutarotase